ncbi:MAG: MoaD/ThiS family protein [Promethearchaeota archaeon]
MSTESVIVANLYGPFYSITGKMKHSYSFDKNSITIEELIEKVLNENPKIRELLFEDGELAENSMIVINGEIVGGEGWQHTKIHPEDRISFFQGQHGG